jgi:NTE family protein
MHRIDASAELDDYEASSKRTAEWDFFVQLRDAGRRAARSWLPAHYGAIGIRGTLDVESALQ